MSSSRRMKLRNQLQPQVRAHPPCRNPAQNQRPPRNPGMPRSPSRQKVSTMYFIISWAEIPPIQHKHQVCNLRTWWEKKPPTDCEAGGIRIENNININGGRPTHQQPPSTPVQHPVEPHPMSPRVALESLPLNHPVRLPENQPWMHQDRSGRWIPREEGYLHPGLPPPPRMRNVGTDVHFVDQVEDARRARLYVPGGWRY